MIEFSPDMLEVINDPRARQFYTVRIADLCITDFPTDIVLPDGKMYVSSSMLMAVQRPSASTTVTRDLYKFQMTDSEGTLLGSFNTGMSGKICEVRLGLIDPRNELPMLNEMFILYSGFLDSGTYTYDTSAVGSVSVDITCANPLVDLDSAQPYYCGNEYMQQINPEDTCYEDVFLGATELLLRWGKRD